MVAQSHTSNQIMIIINNEKSVGTGIRFIFHGSEHATEIDSYDGDKAIELLILTTTLRK